MGFALDGCGFACYNVVQFALDGYWAVRTASEARREHKKWSTCIFFFNE